MTDTEKHCYGKNCVRPVHSKGLCGPHYGMMKRKGHVNDPLGYRGPKGHLTASLKAASVSESPDCVIVTMPSRDRVVVKYNGRQMHAARAVWFMANGDPGAAHVLHNCGNGHAGCVNIQHLYLGDHAQNMVDKVNDDTSARGARNVFAKLDVPRVQAMRRSLLAGQHAKLVAAEYGVSLSCVTMMTSGGSWGWLPWPDRLADGSTAPIRFKGQAKLDLGTCGAAGADITGTKRM